jgi:hypothetical protein
MAESGSSSNSGLKRKRRPARRSCRGSSVPSVCLSQYSNGSQYSSILTISRQTGKQTVCLIVGKEKGTAEYTVHEILLCRIPYFSKTFDGEFQEAQISLATFPEDKCQPFDDFIEWLYKGAIRKLKYWECDLSWDPIEVWLPAHKLGITKLNDDVMDELWNFHKSYHFAPSRLMISTAYELTPSGSMRKYMAHHCAYNILRDSVYLDTGLWEMSELMVDFPELSLDVLRLLRRHCRFNALPHPASEEDVSEFHCSADDQDHDV